MNHIRSLFSACPVLSNMLRVLCLGHTLEDRPDHLLRFAIVVLLYFKEERKAQPRERPHVLIHVRSPHDILSIQNILCQPSSLSTASSSSMPGINSRIEQAQEGSQCAVRWAFLHHSRTSNYHEDYTCFTDVAFRYLAALEPVSDLWGMARPTPCQVMQTAAYELAILFQTILRNSRVHPVLVML